MSIKHLQQIKDNQKNDIYKHRKIERLIIKALKLKIQSKNISNTVK